MIEALDSIARDSVTKRNSIKFLKKVGAFDDNSFSYPIRSKPSRHKLHVIVVV